MNFSYDVIVVGGGHAGCEAALAAARMGARTMMLTMNLDTVGLMSCNPAIGGLAKGVLVREVDALGGEMARAIDATGIQFRMLNTKKGPAVQALRAQADKQRYRAYMKNAVESQAGLDLKQGLVQKLLVKDGAIAGLAGSFRGNLGGAGGRSDAGHLHARPSALWGQKSGRRARGRGFGERTDEPTHIVRLRLGTHENGNASPPGREIH